MAVSTSSALNAGQDSETFTVTLSDDAGDPVFEGPQTFDLVLRNAGGSGDAADTTIPLANGGGEYHITITIIDTEDMPLVSIGNAQTVENVTPVEVPITLVGKTEVPVTVSYQTADPTTGNPAMAGSDYTASDDDVVFAAQATTTTQNVSIVILNDTTSELDEVFVILLTETINANIDVGSGSVTIVDDERAANDAYTMAEDTTLNVTAEEEGVLGNDIPDLGTVLIDAGSTVGPANAADFTLNADGTFTYEPVADFSGIDTFTYRFNDGGDLSNVATVTITVEDVNDAPVGSDAEFTVQPGQEHVEDPSGVLANVTDVDEQVELTATLVQDAQ